MTTLFGPDISSYQSGLDLARLAHAAFVIAKVTEGTYYTDDDYQGWRQQAAHLGQPFVWYHFLSGEDAGAQARHTLANVGDTSLPGMLDAEQNGNYHPTLAQMVAYTDAAHGAGLNLRLVYLPHWYWQQIGSPGLGPLADRGLNLISSAYPGGSGTPTEIYPGDGADGWQAYGGMTPLLYQFTNQASDGGQLLDYNAYRGSAEELAAALSPGGVAMGSYTMSTGWQADYPDAAAELQKHIPAGMEIDEGLAAAYGMVRSLVAAFRTGVIDTKVDQVLQILQHQAPPPQPAPAVDVNALATALVNPLAAALTPHITGGVDPAQIAEAVAEPVAHAVLMHMAGDLQAG